METHFASARAGNLYCLACLHSGIGAVEWPKLLICPKCHHSGTVCRHRDCILLRPLPVEVDNDDHFALF